MENGDIDSRKLVVDNSRQLERYVHLTKEYDDIIALAAAHIEDAKKGRGQHGKSYAMESSPTVRFAYNVMFSGAWHYFIILIILSHCLLLFAYENNPSYLSSELFCLFWYIVDIILQIAFFTPRMFFSFSKTALRSKIQLLLTILFLIDAAVLLYFFIKNDRRLDELTILFQCFRPMFFIIKIETVSHIFMVVVKTFSRIIKTLLAIILFICFFSCVAVHTLGEIYHTENGDFDEEDTYFGQFDNIGSAFVRLFVLITTENYPDVKEPAFHYHEATIIFFVIFIYVGVFILLSILLAIVVDNYWTIAKMNVKKDRLQSRKQLALAWALLVPDGEDKLSVHDENLLGVFRMLKPKNADDEIVIMLQQLASTRSIIEYKSWLTRVTEILDLEVERADDTDSQNLMPGLVRKCGKGMIYLTLTIQSTIMQRIILILLYLHTLLFAFFQYGNEDMEKVVQLLRVAISAVFTVEVVVRVSVLAYVSWDQGEDGSTLGKRIRKWLSKTESVDVADVCLVFVGSFANGMWFYAAQWNNDTSKMTAFIAKGLCVVVSSIAFILRLTVNSAEAKKGYRLVRMILPVMLDLCALFVISIYCIASFAETFFSSFIHSTDTHSTDGSGLTCDIGFETFNCSLITVFQVATTSNWHDILQRTLETKLSYGAAVFFILIYIILHMVIINLFVAISYEAYNKFVSKAAKGKSTGEGKQGVKRKLKHLFTKYTAGNRRITMSSSPRPPRRTSVTIKRKSLHKMHEKISDSSLGEGGPQVETAVVSTREQEEAAAIAALPPEKRHEAILKQRMQKKAEAKGRPSRRNRTTATNNSPGFADVVRQYTAKADNELSLSPGQKVKILESEGTKCKGLILDGPNAGSNGWFPAFVVGTFVSEMNKSTQHRRSLPKTDSQPKFVKKQRADWTKDIIGQMTIMNPEELRELNKILKANARHRGSTDSHRSFSERGSESRGSITDTVIAEPKSPKISIPTTPRSNRIQPVPIMKIVEEEEEEEEEEEDDGVFVEISKLYTEPMKLPEVVIEQPSVILEDEEEEEKDVARLQSPKILTPEMKAKEKWKKKAENRKGDMPEWARKFMASSNAKIADASSLKSPTDSEASTDPLGRALEAEMENNNAPMIPGTADMGNVIENTAAIEDFND